MHFLLECPFYHFLRKEWSVPDWFLSADTPARCLWLGKHLHLLKPFVDASTRFLWEWGKLDPGKLVARPAEDCGPVPPTSGAVDPVPEL